MRRSTGLRLPATGLRLPATGQQGLAQSEKVAVVVRYGDSKCSEAS